MEGLWKDRHTVANEGGPQIKITYYVPNKKLFKLLNILI